MKYKKYIVYDRQGKVVIITSNKAIARKYSSVYDGPEIGSTGLLRVKEITGKERPSKCGETHAICPKL